MASCQLIAQQLTHLRNLLNHVHDPEARAEIADEIAALEQQQLDQGCLQSISIFGVEHTQAVQFWNVPEGQGSGFAPNNTIPLVAQKPTVLRAYVAPMTESRRPPASIAGVLHISGPAVTIDLSSLNGPIPAKPISEVQRTVLGDTLNFRIPANWCVGAVSCDLQLSDPARSDPPLHYQFTLRFEDVPVLPLHGVLIHYTGLDFFNNPVDATPTPLDVLVVADSVLRTYPISGFFFDGCEILQWSAQTSVTQNFVDLYNAIANLRALSGTDDIYWGILPNAANCGAVCGLGGNGTALFFQPVLGTPSSGAWHETGHALGRAHAPCGNPPGPDPNYPTYNSFPQGSIGEVGIDGQTLAIHDPRLESDFMSYCGPVWVSPYTYMGLKHSVQSSFTSRVVEGGGSGASVWATEKAEFYHLALRVHRQEGGHRAEIRSAIRFTRRPPRGIESGRSNLTLEVYGENDTLIGVHTCEDVTSHILPDHPFIDYLVDFPASIHLKLIRLVRAGRVLLEREVGREQPIVRITEVKRVEGQHGNLLRVRWSGEAPSNAEPPLRYAVRYSSDGICWRPLAVDLTASEHVANLDLLPGGEQCRVQVLASAGLRTAIAQTEYITVPQKPRKAYIVYPQECSEAQFGDAVLLGGAAFSPDWGAAAPDETTWHSDVAGPLGAGNQILVLNLPVGSHRIAMRAPDGHGSEASSMVTIRIRSRREQAHIPNDTRF